MPEEKRTCHAEARLGPQLPKNSHNPQYMGQDGQQNQQQSPSTPTPTPMQAEEGTGGSNSQGAVDGVQLGDLLAHPEMLRQMVGQSPSKESDEKGGEGKEANQKEEQKEEKEGKANQKEEQK